MAQLKSMIRTQFTSPVAMMDVIASNMKVLAAELGVDFSDLFSVVVFHRAFGDGNEYTVTVGSDKFTSVDGRAEALVVRDSAVSYTISSEGFEDITGSLVASGVNEEILLPRFSPEPAVIGIPSVYEMSVTSPATAVVGEEFEATSSIYVKTEGSVGYASVLFVFDSTRPQGGNLTFKAVDSLGQVQTFVNSGVWGPPDVGFSIPADYSASTQFTMSADMEGDYTVTCNLVNLADSSIICSSTSSVSITAAPPKPVMCTITINPTPSDAEVKLNGTVQSSVSVESGSSVSYEVSKDGYTPKSGSVVADSTKTVDVVLEAIPVAKVTITINPTPADATVKLNNVEQKSIEVDEGSSVSYEVSKDGYTPKSDSVVADSTKTVDVVLEAIPVEKVTITINPTPADATVKLNSVEQKSIEVDKGSQVTYEVSKTDYVTKSETVTASATQTIDVVLDAVSAPESDPEVASLEPEVAAASTRSSSKKK